MYPARNGPALLQKVICCFVQGLAQLRFAIYEKRSHARYSLQSLTASRRKLLLRVAGSLANVRNVTTILEMQVKVTDALLGPCVVELPRAIHAPNPWQEVCFVVCR